MQQEQADKITIQNILNTDIADIKSILDRGEVNRVYLVKQKTKTTVFRLNDIAELARFKKEVWCSEEATKKGIPGAQVIDIGVRNNIAYMILEFIPGLNGNDITGDKSKIWFDLGLLASKIHSIGTEGFGEDMIYPGQFMDTWERYVKYNVTSLNNEDKLLKMHVLNPDDSARLREEFSNLLEKQFRIGLTHGDLSLANVITKNEEISLIDWGSAESTVVPHFEIIGILEDSLSESDPLFSIFLKGYGIEQKEYIEMKPDIVALTLLRAVDKLRWAIDRSPDNVEEMSGKVTKLLSSQLKKN